MIQKGHRWHFQMHFLESKLLFLNENVIENFSPINNVPPINNIPSLVQIMAWRRSGDKPLSEAMMASFNDA